MDNDRLLESYFADAFKRNAVCRESLVDLHEIQGRIKFCEVESSSRKGGLGWLDQANQAWAAWQPFCCQRLQKAEGCDSLTAAPVADFKRLPYFTGKGMDFMASKAFSL